MASRPGAGSIPAASARGTLARASWAPAGGTGFTGPHAAPATPTAPVNTIARHHRSPLVLRAITVRPPVPGSRSVFTALDGRQAVAVPASGTVRRTGGWHPLNGPAGTKITKPGTNDGAGDVTVDSYVAGRLVCQTNGFGSPEAATFRYGYDDATNA